MRNTLILITIAFASIGNTLMADGWGQKQTQRTIGTKTVEQLSVESSDINTTSKKKESYWFCPWNDYR